MKITSKNLYEEYAKSHRAIWRWVAETGKGKIYWPGWFGDLELYPRYTSKHIPSHLHGEVEADCFACAVRTKLSCKNGCPIVSFRINENKTCAQFGGFYNLYKGAESGVARKKYAKIIAELPWLKYEIYVKYIGVELYSFDIPEIEKAYGPLEFTY